MSDLRISIDSVPPSLNNLYKTVMVKGHPSRVLTGPARKWKTAAALIIRAAAARQRWAVMKKQPLAIAITYAAPNILQWDVDGKAKLLIDALCDAFAIDDRYVMDLRQSKTRSPHEHVAMLVSIIHEESI